jgi:hypothetical protein
MRKRIAEREFNQVTGGRSRFAQHHNYGRNERIPELNVIGSESVSAEECHIACEEAP